VRRDGKGKGWEKEGRIKGKAKRLEMVCEERWERETASMGKRRKETIGEGV
jgi:hypothetical protein